ncbi:rho GTPase-activating protein 26-like [Amphiura filiformis]|uniref:rho GTPase-activating protein 26-like n=1 Tax=Amphiura filiformis TaxID=82378 RepID=UPI003B21CF4B
MGAFTKTGGITENVESLQRNLQQKLIRNVYTFSFIILLGVCYFQKKKPGRLRSVFSLIAHLVCCCFKVDDEEEDVYPGNDIEKKIKDEDNVALLEKCVGEVEKNGINTVGIYRVSGLQVKVDKLIQDREIPQLVSQHVLASSVKKILKSLPAIINAVTQEKIVRFYQENEKFDMDFAQELIGGLNNQYILQVIIVHLSKITQNNLVNKMNPENLATCLVQSLAPTEDISLENIAIVIPSLLNFITFLIINAPTLYNLTPVLTSPRPVILKRPFTYPPNFP